MFSKYTFKKIDVKDSLKVNRNIIWSIVFEWKSFGKWCSMYFSVVVFDVYHYVNMHVNINVMCTKQMLRCTIHRTPTWYDAFHVVCYNWDFKFSIILFFFVFFFLSISKSPQSPRITYSPTYLVYDICLTIYTHFSDGFIGNFDFSFRCTAADGNVFHGEKKQLQQQQQSWIKVYSFK